MPAQSSASAASSRSSQRSSSRDVEVARRGRLRSLRRGLRAALSLMRLLRHLPRLMAIALIFTLATATMSGTSGPARAQASVVHSSWTRTRTPMASPPPSFERNFDAWTPCSDGEPLTLEEWTSCSSAYNTDRLRANTSVALWLLVALGTATFLLTAIRRR